MLEKNLNTELYRIMNIPHVRRDYWKFVQLYAKDHPPLIVFQLQDALRFHGEIFKEAVMKTRNIFDFPTQKGIDTGKDIPVLKHEEYHAVGMGYADVDPERKFMILGGMSKDYELRPDLEHARRFSLYFPEWAVRINGVKDFMPGRRSSFW